MAVTINKKLLDNASKKRKRDEGALKPSGEERQQLRFSQIEDTDGWWPAIVSSPGFTMKSEGPLEVYSTEEKQLLLHSSEHPKLDFVACEDADQSLKHYIGIYDPESEQIKLIPAKSLIMRTTLKNARTIADDAERLAAEGGISARMLLGEEFGTKRAKKAVEDMRQNALAFSHEAQTKDGKVVLDNAASAVLETMESVTATMASRAVLQERADASKPLPKMNLAAERVDDVFSLDDIVGREGLGALDTQPWRDSMAKEEDIQLSSKFAIDRVINIMSKHHDDLKKTRQDKLLKYYIIMLDWYRLLSAGKRGTELLTMPKKDYIRAQMGDVDVRIQDRLRKKFSSNTGKMDKWHRQYFFTNICAVALIIDDYSIDLYSLQEDLGLDRSELATFFKEIGCQIKAPTNKERIALGIEAKHVETRRIAHLRLPLSFPKMRQRR